MFVTKAHQAGVGLIAMMVGLGLTLGGATAANADPTGSGSSDIHIAAPPPASASSGGDGYIPWSFDTKAIDDASYGANNNGLPKASNLPIAYTVPDYATPAVRNQGQFGDCWAFSSSEAAESSLVNNGVYGSTSSTTQISPVHLVQSVYLTNTFPSTGGTDPYNNGGNARWQLSPGHTGMARRTYR